MAGEPGSVGMVLLGSGSAAGWVVAALLLVFDWTAAAAVGVGFAVIAVAVIGGVGIEAMADRSS